MHHVSYLPEAVNDADPELLLTKWAGFKALVPADLEELVTARRIIDGRYVFDSVQWRGAGWENVRMGQLYAPLGDELYASAKDISAWATAE